jgi:hypothetical protein
VQALLDLVAVCLWCLVQVAHLVAAESWRWLLVWLSPVTLVRRLLVLVFRKLAAVVM